MHRMTMALLAMALSAASSAVLADDDSASATSSDTAPLGMQDFAAPSENPTAVEMPGPNAQAAVPDDVPDPNAQTAVPDAVPDSRAKTPVPDPRAASPSRDRAVRH